MKLQTTLAASLLALACALPISMAQAEPAIALASPIVELVGIAKSADLGLSDEQKARLDAWVKEAPVKRKAMENEQVQLRTQLREAILSGKSAEERKALIDKIAANEAQQLTMRSGCTDFLRNLLTPEQFEKVVTAYKAK
ncbi:MAG: Spy/CpxP family protein refolding chaperone [Pseudomonadota bacterium]